MTILGFRISKNIHWSGALRKHVFRISDRHLSSKYLHGMPNYER